MLSKCGSWPDLTATKSGTKVRYEKVNDHAGICHCFDGRLCPTAGFNPGAGDISHPGGDTCPYFRAGTRGVEKRKGAGG